MIRSGDGGASSKRFHAKGGVIFLQLWHVAGFRILVPAGGALPVAPSAAADRGQRMMAMTPTAR